MPFDRPVRFVYFDLDDTLLDHHYAEHRALEALHADPDQPFGGHGFEAVHVAYRAINPLIWKAYAAGDLDKIGAKVGRFRRLLEELSLPTGVDAQLADRYLDHYSRFWRPVPGALDAFHAIAERWPVGILTNGFVEIQQAKLRQYPDLSERSAAVVISEEVGVLKPHPDLFAEAARRAGTAPEHILYVGDSMHSDVEGGLGAGWQVAWFSASEHDHPDVRSFSDWNQLVSQIPG
ncbi:MAG: HAD-IA family hydrolase [Bacteroidetes bacterium]|nr:HAD-IA family hydrolase [Bacteroidota bacterium]